MLVSRTADDGILGLSSIAISSLDVSAMSAAATAASMATAADHQDHTYAEHQPKPVLR